MHGFSLLVNFTISVATLNPSWPLSNPNILLKFLCQRAKKGSVKILLLQITYGQKKRCLRITRISSVGELKAKLCSCLCRDVRGQKGTFFRHSVSAHGQHNDSDCTRGLTVLHRAKAPRNHV